MGIGNGAAPFTDADHKSQWTAAILVGGESKRMGRPKQWATIEGKPLVWHVAYAVARSALNVEELLVVGASQFPQEALPSSLAGKCRPVPDRVVGKGPLGGIVSALEACRTPFAVVLACDMPFVSGLLLETLASAVSGPPAHECAIFRLEGVIQTLPAAFATCCVRTLEETLERRILSLQEAYSRLDTVIQEPPPGSEPAMFLRVNTPQDLTVARQVAKRRRPGGGC
jgi:molybdopterin-guanine dinucleotide biosynthesis protein A